MEKLLNLCYNMYRGLIEKLFRKISPDFPSDYFSFDEEKLILQHVGKEESFKRLLKFYMQKSKDRFFVSKDEKEKGKYMAYSYLLGLTEVKTKIESNPINYQNNRYI